MPRRSDGWRSCAPCPGRRPGPPDHSPALACSRGTRRAGESRAGWPASLWRCSCAILFETRGLGQGSTPRVLAGITTFWEFEAPGPREGGREGRAGLQPAQRLVETDDLAEVVLDVLER